MVIGWRGTRVVEDGGDEDAVPASWMIGIEWLGDIGGAVTSTDVGDEGVG